VKSENHKEMDLQKPIGSSNQGRRYLNGYLIAKIEELSRQLKEVNQKLEELRTKEIKELVVSITALKTKASIWGALAGSIAALLFSGLIPILWQKFFILSK